MGPTFVGTISAWPGDEGWEQDVSDLLHGDGNADDDGDAGCSAMPARGSHGPTGVVLLGLAMALLRRRRPRS
jgi:MYXO-CTERM domain-containing protein